MNDLMRVIRWVGELVVLLAATIAIAWAFGAVWFDAPFGNANKVVAGLLAIASAAALVFVRRFWRKVGAIALIFGGILGYFGPNFRAESQCCTEFAGAAVRVLHVNPSR